MSLDHDPSRFDNEFDGAYDCPASREYERVRREKIAAALAEYEAAAHKLAHDLEAAGALHRWVPGYSGIYGYVPGGRQSVEDAAVDLASDARANAVCWLSEDVRGEFEQ